MKRFVDGEREREREGAGAGRAETDLHPAMHQLFHLPCETVFAPTPLAMSGERWAHAAGPGRWRPGPARR